MDKIDEENLPYGFEIRRAQHVGMDNYSEPVDVDGDGVDEIIFINKRIHEDDTHYLRLKNYGDDETWFQKNCRGFIVFHRILPDLDKDAKRELAFSECIADTAYLHVISATGKNITEFIAAVNPLTSEQKWYCGCDIVGIIDGNRDDQPDFLVVMQTNYAYQPRGIFLYDIFNEKILWEHYTGFVPNTVHLIDLNGDGAREILMGASAPANGVGRFVNGTDDATVYITVLDSLGNLRYRHRFRDDYNILWLHPRDTDGDGRTEIYFIACSMRAQEHQKDIFGQWDYIRNELVILTEFDRPTSPHIAFIDAEGDEQEEVLFHSMDGLFEIRHIDMNLFSSRMIPEFRACGIRIHNLNEDSADEFVTWGMHKNNNYLCLFDRNLKLKAMLRSDFSSFMGEPFPLHCGSNQPLDLLFQSGETLYTLRLRKQLAAYLPLPLNWLLVITMLLMLTTVVAVLRRSQIIHRTAGFEALREVFNSLRESIVILDQNGRVIQFNREIIHLGLPHGEEGLQMSYKTFFERAGLCEIVALIDRSYRERQPLLSQELVLMENGKPMNLLVYVALFPMGGIQPLGRIVLLRSITEVVEHERALAWAGMAHRLAHELKTPLATVRLSTQQIESEMEKHPDVAQRTQKYLQHILHQVERLRKTSQDFLKFASVENTTLEPVDMKGLIEDCLLALQIKMGPPIIIETDFAAGLPKIALDRDQMFIALKNILDNSLNAMPDGGTLTIHAEIVQIAQNHKERNSMQIEISDTGYGIARENLKKIFQPFFSSSEGGTGLGLVIAQKIIKDHRGDIGIRSTEGKGTKVTILLPTH
ncbi:ATP-binding protein [candidate division KSB1 bacterium]|nr:ATP-binding protein [candidate division KSB1 bacterium]